MIYTIIIKRLQLLAVVLTASAMGACILSGDALFAALNAIMCCWNVIVVERHLAKGAEAMAEAREQSIKGLRDALNDTRRSERLEIASRILSQLYLTSNDDQRIYGEKAQHALAQADALIVLVPLKES